MTLTVKNLFKLFLLFIIYMNCSFGLQLGDKDKMDFHDMISMNDILFFNNYVQDNSTKLDNGNYGSTLKIYSALELKKNNPFNFLDIHFEGQISKFYFHINPVFVNSISKDFIGSKYSRSNLSARFDNAYLKYEQDNLYFKIGRSEVNWGDTHSYSIIQSGLSPGYDHLGFNINYNNFEYELINRQLSSVEDEQLGRVKRFISAKKIKFILSDNFSFGFGDQIIYTGQNRSIELHYLNPFIPYFLSGLENEEEETILDNDNSMIFLFCNYKIMKNLSLFSELLIDDFQIDETNRPDKMGFKIGLNGYIPFAKNKLSFYMDFSLLQASTYTHPGMYTEWDNLNYNLGSIFGGGSKNYFTQFVCHLTDHTKILLEFSHVDFESYKDKVVKYDNYNNKRNFYDFSVIRKYSNSYFKIGKKNIEFPYGIKKSYYQFSSDEFYLSFVNNFNIGI